MMRLIVGKEQGTCLDRNLSCLVREEYNRAT